MKKQVLLEGTQVRVVLDGPLYSEDGERLRPELLHYITQGYSRFFIDMSGVSYIDSAGIATLIAVNKGAVRLGGEVVLYGLQGVVRELFAITQLDTVFQVRDSQEQ